MKRKPTSLRDLILAVANVNHPDLDHAHRAFLSALAPFASVPTGENVRPGFDYLSAALHCHRDTIRRYANNCIALGLIKVTREPHGKGVATEWRFCFENDAYPDSYIGLVPREHTDQRKALAPKLGTAQGMTLAPHHSSSHAVKTDSKTALAADSDTASSTPSTSTTASTPRSQIQRLIADHDGSHAIELRRWMRRTYTEKHNENLRVVKSHWEKVDSLLADYSLAVVRVVWKTFLIADELPAGWKFPLHNFIEEFDSYLVRVEKASAPRYKEVADELWRIRHHLCFALMGEAFSFEEFHATLSTEEKALHDRHRAYLKKTRDDFDVQRLGIPLHFAGALYRLEKKGQIWSELNKELIDKRHAEEHELAVTETGEGEESL